MTEENEAPDGYQWVNGVLKQRQGNGSDQTPPNPALSDAEVAALTDDDLKRMARESLTLMIHNNKGDLRALGAIRELLDRLEGKPVQRNETSLDVRSVHVELREKAVRSEKIARLLGLPLKA